MSDEKKLRDFATEHSQRLGLRTEDIVQWRMDCPPGAVIELLDEIERLRRTLAEERYAIADGIIVSREQWNAMVSSLAAMTAARDALAEVAGDLNGDNGDDDELHRRCAEIAALRKVGQ